MYIFKKYIFVVNYFEIPAIPPNITVKITKIFANTKATIGINEIKNQIQLTENNPARLPTAIIIAAGIPIHIKIEIKEHTKVIPLKMAVNTKNKLFMRIFL